MIVFSVAFGEAYITALFERCLPSLFLCQGYDGSINEPISLVIYTANEFAAAIKARANALPFATLFTGGIEVETSDSAPAMLQKAVARCLSADETFMFAVPDLIYSAGTVANAYRLHRVTGRTVALFNGRVRSDISPPVCATVPFFLENSNRMWALHTSESLGVTAGIVPGHMIFLHPKQTMIFCSVPNPFMGRFTAADIDTLARGTRAWDHEFTDKLRADGRLIVQTSLDHGFSIEPCPKVYVDEWLAAPRDPEDALRRKKFGHDVPVYCFTGTTTQPLERNGS